MHKIRFHHTGGTMSLSQLDPIVIPDDGVVDVDDPTYEVIAREIRGYFVDLDSSGAAVDETSSQLVQQLAAIEARSDTDAESDGTVDEDDD